MSEKFQPLKADEDNGESPDPKRASRRGGGRLAMDRRWILYALAFLVTSSVSGVGASHRTVSASRRASTRHPPTHLRALFACVSVIPPAADAR
jgi:hypothetical protein